MAVPFYGERYIDADNGDLAAFLKSGELLSYDFQTAMRFYKAYLGGDDDDARPQDRALMACNDRFFMLFALLRRPDIIKPWLYDRCREVEFEPNGFIDLWARYHYKSTIITFAGTIQGLVQDPEMTVGIFSATNKIAKPFLRQIKEELETNDLLKETFPDVLWQDPKRQAPTWSITDGITVRRSSNPKEASVEAFGLIDGMPTGRHFRRLLYDDLINEKHVTNPEMVAKITERWELSDNLGVGEATEIQTVGTRYCTIGSMRITMADWTQRKIEDVKIGDVVVGWEKRGGKRWLRPAKVINRGVHKKQPVNKYVFDHGRSVICTDDHKWWRGPHGGGPEYAPLGLPIGNRNRCDGRLIGIRELLVPFDLDMGRDAGWLAGMFDGEGTTKKNKNYPSGIPVIVQSMSNPELIKELRECLTRLNFSFSENWHRPSLAPAGTRPERNKASWKDRCAFNINGGWRERYRFLCQIAPTKTRDLAPTLFGQVQTEGHKLVSIENAGHEDVHWLETETGNYVIEGFCSSNSFADTYGIILERGVFRERIYPATHNGRLDGKPVFLSPEHWEKLKRKQRSTISSQMLQNPVAGKENTFKPEWFRGYEIRPEYLSVYIMCDPSSGRSRKSDRTAIAVIGVDGQENKYLLDGFRHRMSLSERWDALLMLHRKWSRERGVTILSIGYEKYGMQSDLEHFETRMQELNYHFAIKELAWPREGDHSKKSRVERLEPDMRDTKFFLPCSIYENGVGECYWHIDETGGKIAKIPVKGPTKTQARYIEAGRDNQVAKAIRRLDEDRKPYDVTMALIEEMLFFPFAPKDDLVDAASRIYDMDVIPPSIFEERQAEEINDADWADA